MSVLLGIEFYGTFTQSGFVFVPTFCTDTECQKVLVSWNPFFRPSGILCIYNTVKSATIK